MLVTDIQQLVLEFESSVSSAVPNCKRLYPEQGLKDLSSFSMMSSKVFSKVFLKISKYHLLFIVPFFYDRQ